MPQGVCPVHASGKCNLIKTGSGSFCSVSGTEMYGPELVAYEFSSAGSVETRKSARGARTLKRNSIKKRIARETGLPVFQKTFADMFGAASPRRQAVHRESRAKIGRRIRIGRVHMTLGGLMVKSRCNNHVSAGIRDTEALDRMAKLIWQLSVKLAKPKTTYAACRVFAPVFIGATMDIMTRGMAGKDGREYIPKLELAALHKLPPEALKALGISCRNISSVSRDIRKSVGATLDPEWTAAVKQIRPVC